MNNRGCCKVSRVKPHKWTDEQIEFVKGTYKSHTQRELLEKTNEKFGLDLNFNQIKSFLNKNKIRSGRCGKFKKGRTPYNKGMKGVFHGPTHTQFKKGQKSINYLPVGSERVNKDGYIIIKVSDLGSYQDRWKLKHRVLWEEEKGPLKKGEVVIFLDGNKQNVDINNLSLIKRSTLLELNKHDLIKDESELTEIGINIAKLYDSINKMNRNKEEMK